MADTTYISEASALLILTQDGDMVESQARAILSHSRKQSFDGCSYYPMSYIYRRAKAFASKPDVVCNP